MLAWVDRKDDAEQKAAYHLRTCAYRHVDHSNVGTVLGSRFRLQFCLYLNLYYFLN